MLTPPNRLTERQMAADRVYITDYMARCDAKNAKTRAARKAEVVAEPEERIETAPARRRRA